MKLLISFSCCVLISSVVVAAPQEANTEARARILVQQLGNAQFKLREAAAAELTSMGRIAKAALEEGLNSEDAEISVRCSQLLPQALAYDLRFRIEKFLADKEGKQKHDLPLWKEFTEQVGTDPESREIYADMLRTQSDLLDMVQTKNAKEAIRAHALELYTNAFGDPFGGGFRGRITNRIEAKSVFALLFVASAVKFDASGNDWWFHSLYQQQPFMQAMKDTKTGPLYRKVFFSYLSNNMNDNTLNNCSYMLVSNEISEGADLMAKALKDKKPLNQYTKAQAICTMASLGNKSHIPVLQELMKDTQLIQRVFIQGRGKNGECQVRDVALACTIYLSGKNPKDYDFTGWFPPQKRNMIQYHALGFVDEDSRKKAFAKWETDSKNLTTEKKEDPKAPVAPKSKSKPEPQSEEPLPPPDAPVDLPVQENAIPPQEVPPPEKK